MDKFTNCPTTSLNKPISLKSLYRVQVSAVTKEVHEACGIRFCSCIAQELLDWPEPLM